MFTFELSFKAGDELISFNEDVVVTGGFFGGSEEGVDACEDGAGFEGGIEATMGGG